jgi:hypothetical protein
MKRTSLWQHNTVNNNFLNRYVADMSRQRAESILKNEDKEGCFVVRNSSTKGLYTLSLYTKLPHSQVGIKNTIEKTILELKLTLVLLLFICFLTESHT